MTRVTTAELAQRMDELVAAVERGEEVSITTKSGRHLRLVPQPEVAGASPRKAVFGGGAGQIEMLPGFDDPIPDFAEYM